MNPALRSLTAAVTAAGASLPGDLAAALEHARTIAGTPPNPIQKARDAAAELMPDLGSPAAFEKALTKAADALNREEAANRIRVQAGEMAVNYVLVQAKARADEISDNLAASLESHIAALNEHALELGARFSPDKTSTASPRVLAAYRPVEDARLVLDAVLEGLRTSLYPAGARAGRVNGAVWARLPVVDVPEGLDLDEAVRLADAIEGIRVLGSEVSMARHDNAGYWPARVAACGVRFAWANPTGTRERAARLTAALTPGREAVA